MENEIFARSAQWIESWGYFIVFISLLFECTLFLGAFVPGVVILVIAGFFSANGNLSIAVIALTSLIATLIGDNIAFWLGRTYGPKIIKIPDSVKDLFSKKPWIILVFHHAPYTRMFIPAFIGMSKKMNFYLWLRWDTISSILFIATYISVGYLGAIVHKNASDAYNEYVPIINKIALVVLLIWLINYYCKITFQNRRNKKNTEQFNKR